MNRRKPIVNTDRHGSRRINTDKKFDFKILPQITRIGIALGGKLIIESQETFYFIFSAKSSCVKPCFVRTRFIFCDIVDIVCYF